MTPTELQDFLFVFAQVHEEFRIPELESIAELYGFTLNLPADYDISRPFMVLSTTEEQARVLASRCIMIKLVPRLLFRETSYWALTNFQDLYIISTREQLATMSCTDGTEKRSRFGHISNRILRSSSTCRHSIIQSPSAEPGT